MRRGRERAVAMTMRRENGITISRVGHASEALAGRRSLFGLCSIFSFAYPPMSSNEKLSAEKRAGLAGLPSPIFGRQQHPSQDLED